MARFGQSHVALESLEYDDGILVWGGQKVTDIAADTGRTPFYAIDRDRISARVAELRRAMPPELKIHYAMKANPMPEIVQHLVGILDGLDVASAGELDVALATGMDPGLISFAGPGKRDPELAKAINAGITINMESENEMRRIARIAGDIGKKPNVAIRVNPPFEIRSSGMKMGGRPSQFGVDAIRVPEMIEELEDLELALHGFHVYSGSQCLRAEALVDIITKTADLVLRMASSADVDISYVNLGGGFGIPYFARETPLDLEVVAASVERATTRLRGELDNPDIVLELGRYLVGEAGIYVCRVLDIKESLGTRYVICDGGLHHHLAASGNFGQVLRKDYPIANVDCRQAGDTQPVTVVGPLCTPLDLLGERVDLGRVDIGSLIAICQSGAYGLSASPTRFLSHPACSEVFI